MERRTKGFILAAVILIGVMLLPILGAGAKPGSQAGSGDLY